MYALNNVTTTDEYADNELECPGTTELDMTIGNAAVLLQYAFRVQGFTGSAPVWAPPNGVFFAPGFHIRGRNVEGVRIKSAVSGQPAQVTIEAVA
jgi:hypothetical protein